MKKLISRRILSVLLFCIVSTSVFGSAENAVRNDSLLLLCKSGTSTLRPFDRLSQRSAEVSSSLTNNSTNGITSAYIALATVSVVLFFLNSSSLFLFVALLSFLLRKAPFLFPRRGKDDLLLLMFSQLPCTTRSPKFIIILSLFFAFAGKEAAANSAENTGLTPSNEKRQLAVKYTEETSSPVFSQLASTVLQAAATITSTATGGDWSKPATWKNGIVPGAGDDVIIANGATVAIDMDTPALGSLTIGQGTSGILQYDAIAERTVTVSGIVTINSGGTFRSAPPTTAGTIKDNLLVVGVSLINNGTIDFCSQSSGTGIKFIGTTTGNSMFNCESSAKTNLQDTNGVTLEMDNPGKTLLFYPGTDFKVCSTTTKGFLTIVSGIFKLASGAIPFSNPVFSSTSYTIPAAGGFELSNANATITGQNGTVTNQGKIIVSAGTYNIGTATGNSSLTSNDGTFAQSGGTINIAGRFKISGGNCNISGGTMNIATIGYADAREAAFHIAKDANLNIYGAPLITFTYPHSNTVPFNDIYIESGKLKSIAGGTFQMGTAATPELSTFFVNSEIPLDRITVFNECVIRVVNTSEDRIANTVNGTFDKVVLPLTAPENIAVICNGTVPAAYPNLQAFTDAGGKALHNCTLLPASFKFVGQTQSGTSCPYTITRTYQVTDIFGSTGTTQHLIFMEDEATEPPPEAVVEPAKEEMVKLKSATGILADPTATISGGATICVGSDTQITIALTGVQPWAITYQRDGANNVTVPVINSSPYIFNVSVAGTYTISAVSDFDGAGTFSGSAVVNVDPLPTANAGSAMTEICQGGTSATLDGTVGGSATDGTWSSSAGGTFSPNATTLNATWTPPAGYFGTATLTLTTTGGSCSPATDSKTIVVLQMPTITDQPDDVLDCEDRSVNFKVVATGTVTEYSWQRMKPLGSFLDIPGGESGITFPSAGEIKIDNVGGNNNPHGSKYRVIVRNGICSVTSTEATLTVNEITDLTGGTDVTQCSGTNYSYTVTTSYPALTYQWKKSVTSGVWTDISNGGAYSGANTNQLTITGGSPAESGSYRVYMTFDATGADCNVTSDTRTRKLTFLPALTAPVITGPQTICYNTAPTQLSAIAATGGSGTTYSYQWQSSPDNLTWSNVGTNSLTYQPPVLTSSTYYRIIATDAGTYDCGTSTSASVLITVNPLPTATIAGTTAVCEGTLSTSLPYSATTNSPTEYRIDYDGVAETAGLNDVTITILPTTPIALTLPAGINPGTYNAIFYVSNASDCESSGMAFTITINPQPVATNGTVITCSTDALNFNLQGQITNSIASNFTWTVVDNPNVTGESDANGDNITQTLTNISTAAQTVVYTVTPTSESNSCEGSPFTVTVTVNPQPVATNGTVTICSADALNFNLQGQINNSIASNFTWTVVDNPNITGESNASGDNITQTLTNVSSAVQTVVYTVTPTSESNSCAGSPFTVTITVNPTPVVTATPASQTFCSGGTTSISLTSNVAGTTFEWTFVQSGVSGATNGTGTSIAQTLTATGVYAGTATYTIIPTANNCEGLPVDVVITVNTPPAITLDIEDHPTCKDVTVTFTANASGSPAPTVQWYQNGNPMSGQTSTSLTLVAAPNMNGNKYKAVFTNICGTATTYEATLIVGSPLNVDATNTTVISCDGSTGSDVTLNASANGGNGTLLGQWLINTTGNPEVESAWSVIPGTTVTTEIGNLSISYQIYGGNSTYLYKAQFINGGCAESYSGIQTLIIIDNASMSKPPDQVACNGQTTTTLDFSPYATNANSFVWTNNTPSIGLAASGTGNLPIFTATNSTASPIIATITVYPVYTSGIASCQGLPQTFTFTVNPSPLAPEAVDGTSCGPGTVVLDGIGCTDGTLKWYSASTGGIPVGTGSPWTTPSLLITRSYWVSCTTINGCEGPRSEVIATIRPVDPGTIAADQAICSGGDPVAFTSIVDAIRTANGVDINIQWEFNSGSGWAPISGATGQTYNPPPPLTQTTQYRRIVTGSKTTGPPSGRFSCPAPSNVVTVTVNPIPTCSIAGLNSLCAGNTSTYTSTVLPAGGTVTHSWSITETGGTISGSATGGSVTVIADQVCTTQTFILTDNSTREGCPSSCSLPITVNPPTLPVFSAPPANITVACGAIPAPGSLNYTNGESGTCLISGTVISTQTADPGACGGTVTETWNATDACGRALTPVTRTITVEPAALPTIIAPGPVTVNCDAIPASSTLTYTNGLSGACLITGTSNASTFTSTIDNCGGTITETWTATDICGRPLAPVTRIITVQDDTKPTISVQPQDGSSDCVSVNPMLDAGFVAWLENHGGAVATDVCDNDLVWSDNSATQSWVVDLVNHTKTITVTFKVTDDCNNFIETTAASYILNDDLPPTIVCPVSSNVAEPDLFEDFVSGDGCTWIPTTIQNPTFNDICGILKLTYTLSVATVGNSSATGLNYVSSATLNLGITTVTYTIYDAAGNTATCAIRVWIKNIDEPRFTVTCPTGTDKDIVASADADECDKEVTVPAPVIDNFCVEVFSVTYQIDTDPPVSVPVVAGSPIPSITQRFTVGSHAISWVITSASGTPYPCTQTVTVSDNQNPVFVSCPANQEEQIINGGCNKTGITITEPTFSDNCGIDRLTWTMSGATTGSSPATGINYVTSQIFNIGITTVTYTLVDANNLSVTCTFTVWMKNLISPQFAATCPGDVSAVATNLRCDAVVNVPPPTISNPCNELYTVTNNSPFKTSDTDASGTYPVGSTSFTWTVTDASGNVKLCPQTVTVTDTQAPVFTLCPANQSEEIINGGCDKTSITLINPTFTDNCGIDRLTWTMSGATTRSSAVTGLNYVNGEIFNIGITLVTYTVTDVNGLSETCSFTVWMKNLISPQFAALCPVNVSVPADAGLCNANVTVPAPAITNPCNEAYTMVNDFNGTNNASGIYPIGTTTVHWTITDASGNVITCTQTVTVNDLPLVCPDPIIRPADFGQTYATNVIVPPPGFSNNCTGLTLIWSMILPDASTLASPLSGINIVPSPGTFNVGVTTVTYTLTHATDVTESCSFTVTVTAKPDITCLTDITHTADPGECNYTVNPGTPTLVEGAQPITWTYTIGGGTPVTFVGTVANPGPPAIGLYDFPVGTTTINWTATNDSGTDACTQTITVTDDEDQTFTLPPAMSECVESLSLATYDLATTDILPARPDYFIFVNGSTALDLTGLADNCCAIGDLLISWTINFSGGGSLSDTGQPSLHGSDIQLPGDLPPYDNDLVHTITYTVIDCNGNPAAQQTQNITIKPRPNVVKVP